MLSIISTIIERFVTLTTFYNLSHINFLPPNIPTINTNANAINSIVNSNAWKIVLIIFPIYLIIFIIISFFYFHFIT